MQSTLYDAELWRDHAAQMRTLSSSASDPNVRQLMLTTAAGFDTIANLSRALKAEKRPPLVLQLNWATQEGAGEDPAKPLFSW